LRASANEIYMQHLIQGPPRRPGAVKFSFVFKRLAKSLGSSAQCGRSFNAAPYRSTLT